MDIERPPNLRTPGTEPGSATPPGSAGLGGTPPPINALAELVADLIAATGLVPADKLALVRGAAGMGSFAHALVENNLASSEGLAKTLAARYQMPLLDLALTRVSDDATGEIALHVLERLVAIPYALEHDTLRVAIADPVIFQAAEDGASDVHFEPQEDSLLVRFRIDGVLQEVQRIPKRMTPGVLTRLKVLAKLDIAERRKPQDGRISLNAAAAGRMMDVRVATLPTVEGESVVMRLLDKSKRAPTLEELGMSDEMRKQLAQLVRKPTGALLVTGPTGSGKSTTLYAALTDINRPEINIITVEDPVEYRLGGVNQVQINIKAGLTLAPALRSTLPL